jgi:hypothetical protein
MRERRVRRRSARRGREEEAESEVEKESGDASEVRTPWRAIASKRWDEVGERE